MSSYAQPWLSSCSTKPTWIDGATGVAGAILPGPEVPKLVGGVILVAIGHKECITPLRGFGVGLVAGVLIRAILK